MTGGALVRRLPQQSANTTFVRLRQQQPNIDGPHAPDVSTPIRRLQALIKRKREEGKTQAQIATDLGRTQGWVVQVLGDEIRSVDVEVIAAAVRAYDLDANYFTDTRLGDDVDYREHKRRSGGRVPETTLERDVVPGLDEYEQAEGRQLEKRYRDSVIGLARSEGPDAITAEVVSRHVDTLRAIDRGKRVQRPRDPENVIDEARGQQRATQRSTVHDDDATKRTAAKKKGKR